MWAGCGWIHMMQKSVSSWQTNLRVSHDFVVFCPGKNEKAKQLKVRLQLFKVFFVFHFEWIWENVILFSYDALSWYFIELLTPTILPIIIMYSCDNRRLINARKQKIADESCKTESKLTQLWSGKNLSTPHNLADLLPRL